MEHGIAVTLSAELWEHCASTILDVRDVWSFTQINK